VSERIIIMIAILWLREVLLRREQSVDMVEESNFTAEYRVLLNSRTLGGMLRGMAAFGSVYSIIYHRTGLLP